ncbi:membrane peptidoglycan carboxypeptidase [Nocardioides aurantiacus]|uniref:Membrane peptidoglycan carboxypeptidase n=1 Tax=Nocardioides aurantiacus TaxID=86796 RepID=A0A3N2CZD2_9ACTN|nr:membrane peptidoglycan carboxypeptidase [Nocardioides aurantiacus]
MSAQRTPRPSSDGSRPVRRRLRAVAKWTLVVGLVLALVGGGVFYFTYRNTEIPSANRAFEAQSTYVTYSGGKQRIGTFAEQNRESVPLADIPQSMQDAVIAAEDRTFYSNSGIDPKGIIRAAFSNARGNATQGASTITQQYVKLLYLSQERTLSRKVKEAFLSLKVQQERSKEAILEGYLNTIYFGRGAYGVQAASRAFFGKNAGQLTVQESATLAAVLNSPAGLSPDGSDETRARLVSRYDYVLSGMVEAGNIDAAEADRIAGKLPSFVKRGGSNQFGGQRGFMLSMVKDELQRIGFDETEIDTGGLRVETTFTRSGMAANAEGVTERRPEGLKGLHVASASVDVQTGALIGFFAGQDYLRSQLDWATIGSSPGSSFKPFALAAGLDAGYSLRDTFDGNSPYEFEDGSGSVDNQGEGTGTNFGSAISLVTATENSVNTAYADLTDSIPDGPRKIRQMAVRLGVPDDAPGLEPNNAIALGSATVGPVSMANAYATIANGGVAHDVFTVKRVTRAEDGEVLYKAPRETKRVLSEDIASDVSYAMQQVVASGSGTNAQGVGRPAAGKTGTATNADGDVSSSWFVGYTPQVATAVMYARGKGNEALNGFLPTFYGGQYPTLTWSSIMSRLMEGVDVEDFPEPAFVDGDAPEDGHAPYTPPPSPTFTPDPTPQETPSESPSESPSETPTRTPPTSAPPEPTDPGEPVDPGPDLGQPGNGREPGGGDASPGGG